MGAALATCLRGEVYWASDGRSPATAARAIEAGITDLRDLDSLVAAVDVLLSVCPPAAARDVAQQVSALGFGGLYVDLNAVAPATAIEISALHTRFVDGGVIGPPPSPGDGNFPDTRIYLSGEEASEVAGLFVDPRVKSRAIGPDPGQASALKMSYAAWTKGISALLLSVAAVASQEGVLDELMAEWDDAFPELISRLDRTSARIGRKAWRFVGEMEEIARTYADAGLPDGFHLAAAALYSRLADLKDHESDVTVEEIMRLLTEEGSPPNRVDDSDSSV
jgi:3-hydroxyisobutyrate dehydrogenase-like beta-hydroxyacid dehydrogenase